MKAKDLMTKNPKTCEPGHDLLCALRIMKDEDTGIVPVTEGNGQARVVGVVTDRDIASRWAPGTPSPRRSGSATS